MTHGSGSSNPEDDLDKTLRDINAQVGDIADGTADAFDPDAILDRLDESTHALCAALESLVDDESDEPVHPTDLRDAIHRALERSLDDVPFPLVFTTVFDDEIPPIPLASKTVVASLTRAFDLCLAYAGQGGEVRVETRSEGELAAVRLTVNPFEPDGSIADLEVRLTSIREFIGRCGGEVELESAAGGVIDLAMKLPVDAKV